MLRWRAAPLVGAGIPSAIDPIVIGGCGSSGTTLLRRMLDRHPAIFCGPESTVFLSRITSLDDLARRYGFPADKLRHWRDESLTKAEFIERFQAACLARSGKRVWAEKTPENIRHFPAIARRFPRARLVHVIRDGRDVACSLRQAPWLSLEKMTCGADRASPEALEACARYWAARVAFGRRLAGCANYHEVRYEDLLARPEATLRALLDFAGLDFDPRVLEADSAAETRDGGPISQASVGRWRAELSAREAAIVEREAGPLLIELGYARDGAWAARRPPTAVAQPPPPRLAPPCVPWATRLKLRLKAVRGEALALCLALKDGEVPSGPRVVGALAAAYVATPFDLIPDRRPGVGYLDDLLVALIALPLMIRLVPAPLMRRHRIAAARFFSRRIWRVAPEPAPALAVLGRGLGGIGARAAPVWGRLFGATAGYVVDADLRFVTVSPEALRAWGKAAEEVLGRRILEVFPAGSLDSYRAHLEALKTSRAMRLRVTSRILGRPVDVAIRPICDGLRVQFAVAA